MDRWSSIALIAFVLCMFGGMALESYHKNECRIAAVNAGKSAEDIGRICR